MGTCAVGIGATVRQPSLRTRAGTITGRAIPVPKTALEMAATNVGLDWLEFSCSADAQQLSACAWLMTRGDAELCESPLCIGHALSEQHAMRASGVGAHPAQTAALPAEIRTASASANNCLLRVSTHLACRTERQVSTRLRRTTLQSRGLTGLNEHMNGCINMLSMMQKMQKMHQKQRLHAPADARRGLLPRVLAGGCCPSCPFCH